MDGLVNRLKNLIKCAPTFGPVLKELSEEIGRLELDAAKLRKSTGWQPIETAPAGKVLLYYPADSRRELSESINISYGRGHVWRKPTHWMPLPKPPAVEGGE